MKTPFCAPMHDPPPDLVAIIRLLLTRIKPEAVVGAAPPAFDRALHGPAAGMSNWVEHIKPNF